MSQQPSNDTLAVADSIGVNVSSVSSGVPQHSKGLSVDIADDAGPGSRIGGSSGGALHVIAEDTHHITPDDSRVSTVGSASGSSASTEVAGVGTLALSASGVLSQTSGNNAASATAVPASVSGPTVSVANSVVNTEPAPSSPDSSTSSASGPSVAGTVRPRQSVCRHSSPLVLELLLDVNDHSLCLHAVYRHHSRHMFDRPRVRVRACRRRLQSISDPLVHAWGGCVDLASLRQCCISS